MIRKKKTGPTKLPWGDAIDRILDLRNNPIDIVYSPDHLETVFLLLCSLRNRQVIELTNIHTQAQGLITLEWAYVGKYGDEEVVLMVWEGKPMATSKLFRKDKKGYFACVRESQYDLQLMAPFDPQDIY